MRTIAVLSAMVLTANSLAGQEMDRAISAAEAHEILQEYQLRTLDPFADEVALRIVDVEAGQSLSKLLTREGVRPDAQSFALVAELNNLESVDRIQAGTTLLVPTTSTTDGVFSSVTAPSPPPPAPSPPPPPMMTAERYAAQTLERAISLFDATPADDDVLSAEAVDVVVEALAAGDQLLVELNAGTQTDGMRIDAARFLAEDLEAVAACRADNSPCVAPVHVHVLGAKGDTIANLRVFTAPLGKVMLNPACPTEQLCGKEFPSVSPNARGDLVVGVRYAIWAKRNGVMIGGTTTFKPARVPSNVVDLQIPDVE